MITTFWSIKLDKNLPSFFPNLLNKTGIWLIWSLPVFSGSQLSNILRKTWSSSCEYIRDPIFPSVVNYLPYSLFFYFNGVSFIYWRYCCFYPDTAHTSRTKTNFYLNMISAFLYTFAYRNCAQTSLASLRFSADTKRLNFFKNKKWLFFVRKSKNEMGRNTGIIRIKSHFF